MKDLKLIELRAKTLEELSEMLHKERGDLFHLRKRLAFKEEKDVRSALVQRHNIARILTVMTEKQKVKS